MATGGVQGARAEDGRCAPRAASISRSSGTTYWPDDWRDQRRQQRDLFLPTGLRRDIRSPDLDGAQKLSLDCTNAALLTKSFGSDLDGVFPEIMAYPWTGHFR
ncbi:hypothetical protein GCM10027521_62750 [Amycolatopsis cihanbeyliensis]